MKSRQARALFRRGSSGFHAVQRQVRYDREFQRQRVIVEIVVHIGTAQPFAGAILCDPARGVWAKVAVGSDGSRRSASTIQAA